MKNFKQILIALITLLFIYNVSGANPEETNYLFKDSLIGVDLHIEESQSKSNGDIFILYKQRDRVTRTSRYSLLKLDTKGGVSSLEIDSLSKAEDIKFGNISFTENDNLVLSFIIKGEIHLAIFDKDFRSFNLEKIPYDKAVDDVYSYNKKIYAFIKKNNYIDLVTYEYIVGGSLSLKSMKVVKIDNALSVNDVLFIENDKLVFLAEFVTDKNIEKKVGIVKNGKISYVEINDETEVTEIIGISKENKALYLSVVDGSRRRVKNYLAIEVSLSEYKVINIFPGSTGLRWVNMKFIGSNKLVSLEIEKNKRNKKYKLYCKDLLKGKRKQLDINNEGLLRFYGEAFILSGTGENTILAFIYSELKDRVTYDVLSIVEIKKELCNSR